MQIGTNWRDAPITACVECKRINVVHRGRGYCTTCYSRLFSNRKPGVKIIVKEIYERTMKEREKATRELQIRQTEEMILDLRIKLKKLKGKW